MTKAELRGAIRSRLGAEVLRDGAEVSRLIDVLQPQGVVAAYLALADELDLDGWARRLAAQGRLALPRVEDGGLRMCLVHDVDRDVEGTRLRQPRVGCAEVRPDLVLVPGRAFDLRGHRLGRGGGHYDRYLAGYTGPRVGVCLEPQVVENVPTDSWDEPVDGVLTPAGWRFRGASLRG